MIRTILMFLALTGPLRADGEPLAGTIWDVAGQRFITVPELVTALVEAPLILIGETHGRTAHQKREAFLIGALSEAGRRPAVVLEMLARDQSAIVAGYRARQPEYAMALGGVLNWAESNWPSWSFYYPVFNMAFATKAPIIGGDLPDGIEGTITGDQEATSLDYYREGMMAAHCGLIDEARALDLARTQLARDQSMAVAMTEAASLADGAILIAGASHIDREAGVPSLLLSPAITLLLRETDLTRGAFETDPSSAGIDPGKYDYVWFTPATGEETFCDKIGK